MIFFNSFTPQSSFTIPNCFLLMYSADAGMEFVNIGVPEHILSGMDTIFRSCRVFTKKAKEVRTYSESFSCGRNPKKSTKSVNPQSLTICFK